MKIVKTTDPQIKPSVVMMVYGEGGVGKTTFASTAPKPILADFENGSKYLGLRGVDMDIVHIKEWNEMLEFSNFAKKDKEYETIVLDPIGEAMEKVKNGIISSSKNKYVQSDGSLTMAGWGELKKRMRNYIKGLRDTGKNVLIIAHMDEKADEERMIKRPMIQTKLSEEIVNAVDIVGYMTTAKDKDGNSKRIIIVDPEDDKYVAKDRTGQLSTVIEPDFNKIIEAVSGSETFKWSSRISKAKDKIDKIEDQEEIKDTLNKIKKSNNFNKDEKKELIDYLTKKHGKQEQETEEIVEKEENETKEENISYNDRVNNLIITLKNSLKQEELKKLAKDCKLKTTGNKDDLANRIAKDQIDKEIKKESKKKEDKKSRLIEKIKNSDE